MSTHTRHIYNKSSNTLTVSRHYDDTSDIFESNSYNVEIISKESYDTEVTHIGAYGRFKFKYRGVEYTRDCNNAEIAELTDKVDLDYYKSIGKNTRYFIDISNLKFDVDTRKVFCELYMGKLENQYWVEVSNEYKHQCKEYV